ESRTMNRILLALLLAAPVAGCGVSEDLYNARVNELSQLKAQMDAQQKAADAAKNKCSARVAELEQQNAAMKDRLTSLGQNVKDLEGAKTALSGDLEAARKTMEELRRAHEAAEARAAQFRALFAKFKSMIDSGKLKVEIRNGLMLVKLA